MTFSVSGRCRGKYIVPTCHGIARGRPPTREERERIAGDPLAFTGSDFSQTDLRAE